MPKLILDGDAAGAVRATEGVTDKVAKLKAEFKAAGIEALQLERSAKRIVEENATPQERYNSQIEHLSKLFVAGKISVEQMDRAVGNYGKQLDEATKSHDRHKQAHEGSFGGHAVSEILQYAAAAVTAEKGIELVTEALREQAEEKRRAAENVAGGLQGADALVNSGNPAQAKAIAEQLMTSGLIPRNQQGAAFDVGGAIVQSGHANEAEFLQELAEKRIVQPQQLGELSQNVSKVEHGFGTGAGSFEEIVKKIRAAASESGVGASPADVAKNIADLSDEARENGTPFDQALAVFVTEAQKSKSLRTAGAATKKFITEGGDFDGSQASDYQKNLSDIQGSAGKELPDYIASDPLLKQARSAEGQKGGLGAVQENQDAETELLFDRVYDARLTAIREKYGNGFVGAMAQHRLSIEQSGNRFLGAEEKAISDAADYHSDELPTDVLKDIRTHLSQQNQIMQRSDRSLPPPSGLQE